jgi:hypothetical protein
MNWDNFILITCIYWAPYLFSLMGEMVELIGGPRVTKDTLAHAMG